MSTAMKSRARSVPMVYAVVTVALLLAVVGLALSSPPPRTPPLAAVAPQVDEQVDVERVEQSSQFGEGTGGEGDCAPGDEGCAATGAALEDTAQGQPTPRATSAPAAFWPCVVGPGGARQTEDPQSPPCKGARFTGDNGGATWQGVTADTIRLGYIDDPADHGGQVSGRYHHVLAPLIDHVNRRYELYGRRLVLVDVPATGSVSDPAVNRADARAAAQADVFAVIAYERFGAFQRTLAAEGVVSLIGGDVGAVSEAALTAMHPHAWAVYPSIEQAAEITGKLVCGALNGKPARHGGADVSGRVRHFGVVVEDGWDARPLEARLAACGAPVAVYQASGDFELLLRQMRDQGVTTAVCLCRNFDKRYPEAAEALGYQPEWLLPGIDEKAAYLRYTSTATSDNQPRAQLAHTFGISTRLRRPPPNSVSGTDQADQQYWFHAARESDPGFTYGVGAQGSVSATFGYDLYAQLLTLASGIQWAGPNLTPETFGDALAGLRYPNPGVGRSPWWQPSVGFGVADHSFNSDAALIWWRDPSDAGYESRTDFGELCYVGGGHRFTAATMPTSADDLLFDPEAGCR
ncbi:MAG: hypothetical protein WEB19_03620 [Acidimicrobiia bacterium]